MNRGHLFVFLTLGAVVPAIHAQALPNQPIAQLDLKRYVGEWHEIANLPLVFQKQCKDHITATYSAMPNGQLEVINACRTTEGRVDTAQGVARRSSGKEEGALEVRFAPRWLSWLPWVWADYWVLEVDPDYRWAVVGSPSRKYLWVLSRSPSMPKEQFNALRERAAQRGYRVDKLFIAARLD